MANYVNEASTCTVRARFYDLNNSLATPASVRYRITDVSNDRIVRDWTSVTPGSTVSIEVAATDNEISRDIGSRRFERRMLTVQANAGEVSQHAEEIEYFIRNLSGITDED